MISIVVPVYNVELYVEDCLLSIQNQTYSDFECICINDGSTDKGAEIVDKFCKIDSRFILITQENQGLAGARNTGINHAKGEWICFVDSDDMICSSFIETLILNAKKYNSDYISCDFSTIMENQKYISTYKENCNTINSITVSENPFQDTLSDKFPFRVTAWDHLYSTKLFHNVRFDVNMKIHEDTITTFNLLLNANRAIHISQALYLYRIRQGSLTRSSQYEKSAFYLSKNIRTANELIKKLQITNNKDKNSMLTKSGVDELSNLAVSLVLNRSLNRKERNDIFMELHNNIKQLKIQNLYPIQQLSLFIKISIITSYFIKLPSVFRFIYSLLWRKQWKKLK